MNTTEKSIRFSKEVVFNEVEEGTFVGWNRFYPRLLKLNKGAVDFLENIDAAENREKVFEQFPEFEKELFKVKFIFQGDSDRSKEIFLEQIDEECKQIDRKAGEFYDQKQFYSQLYIHNSECNLNCRYCAKKYKNENDREKMSFAEKRDILDMVVDQYIDRKIKNNQEIITFSFNGGEILLEWPLIKHIAQRNQEIYPGLKFKYFVNTNITLMTKEIAQFMSRHDFELVISIDGYPLAHDLTRIYYSGKGSANDVLKGVEIYRKYNKSSIINGFQGTIENADTFDTSKVYEMERFGFSEARLFPNLLNITEEDAVKKAKIMGKFLELNMVNKFKTGDSHLEKLITLVKAKDYQFHSYCMGLCTLPRMGIFLNTSTMKLSHVCSYVSKPAVHVKELGFDIYSQELWKASRQFVRQRLEVIKTYCIDCELAAICKGDCVMGGLDCENMVNKAACTFQKELWRIVLNHMYTHDLKAEQIG